MTLGAAGARAARRAGGLERLRVVGQRTVRVTEIAEVLGVTHQRTSGIVDPHLAFVHPDPEVPAPEFDRKARTGSP